MTKTCIVTGKGVISANNVSHSNRHTKRRMFANLTKRRLLNPATGRMQAVWITAAGLRTLKKWTREGKAYDLNKMKSAC
jgi:large subunit ribosomal protein L28